MEGKGREPFARLCSLVVGIRGVGGRLLMLGGLVGVSVWVVGGV